MKLLKKEQNGNSIASKYDAFGEIKYHCEKLFSSSIKDKNITVITSPEDMMLNDSVKVKNYTEFKKLEKKVKIHSVKFEGVYHDSKVDIVLDYDLSTMSVTSDNKKINKTIINIY